MVRWARFRTRSACLLLDRSAGPGGAALVRHETLIFTPARPLPDATKYTVTIAGSATALSGNRLGKPYRFSFTTPLLKLVRTSWYRKSGKIDPRSSSSSSSTSRSGPTPSHPGCRSPTCPTTGRPPRCPGSRRWKSAEPAGFAAFEAKVVRSRADAQREGAVPGRRHTDLELQVVSKKHAARRARDRGAPAVNTWIRARVARGARGSQGRLGTAADQDSTIRLEPAFFVDGFRCEKGATRTSTTRSVCGCARRPRRRGGPCRYPRHGPGQAPSPAARAQARGRPRLGDAGPALPPVLVGGVPGIRRRGVGRAVAPEEAGYSLAPARAYSARVDAALRALDGRRSVTRGSAASRTGTRRPSRASAPDTACGKHRAARCFRSPPATCGR